VLAGFAHKDRALAHLAEGDDAVLPMAETHLKQAETLFRGLKEPFAEGLGDIRHRLSDATSCLRLLIGLCSTSA
jgi:hypothetical protein